MPAAWLVALAARLVALLALTAVPGAALAGPASALGPEMPMLEPAGGFTGRLAVSPESAPVGSAVTVTGSGFPGGADLDLVWRTVRGTWLTENGEYHGREFTPVAYRIAVVRTDTAGAFTATFEAPEDFGFQHDIVIQDRERMLTQTGFSIDLTMSATPSVRLGQPVEIEITGIGWRDLENSWMLVYDSSFAGWVSAVSTSGTARFSVPATGAVGTHVLRMVHGAFTFPYLNPEQNPVPDRVRPRAEFQLVAGDPVLPVSPGEQRQASVRGLPAAGEIAPSPAFGGVGDRVSVTAAGLEPGKTYQLQWSTVVGNRVAQNGWDTRSRPLVDAVADADGVAAFSFDVPDDLGGAHELSLDVGDGVRTGSFWITPTALPLDVASGPAGTDFTIHLKGVGWTETANIYNLTYDNAYLGYACGFNSQGDITIHLTAAGEPGWHFIDLYPGIYKGKESRPNNFRIPQLTYAADHPGEDLPAFRFAFEVTAPE